MADFSIEQQYPNKTFTLISPLTNLTGAESMHACVVQIEA
jgi:hypothetical protein